MKDNIIYSHSIAPEIEGRTWGLKSSMMNMLKKNR